jgi:hypothetical protein
MARKQTEADKLAASLERQLAALNAQPSPVDVVKNIINPTASTREVNTYEEAVSRFSEIQKKSKIRRINEADDYQSNLPSNYQDMSKE